MIQYKSAATDVAITIVWMLPSKYMMKMYIIGYGHFSVYIVCLSVQPWFHPTVITLRSVCLSVQPWFYPTVMTQLTVCLFV